MRSPLAYIGGKSQLVPTLLPLIPNHKTYVEVFCGAGWLFFSKEPSRYEIINDLDSDLITFYRVLQHHLNEFLTQFKWLLSSRQVFQEWAKQQEAGGLTDIQRAARYYYLQRHAFGARVKGRTWGGSAVHRAPKINLLRIEEEMSEVYLRLQDCVIENLPYQECLRRFDKADVFFYLDPPYYKKPYYQHNLEHNDFVEMANVLRSIQAPFLLSLNDTSEVRDIFSGFAIKSVSLKYGMAKDKKKEDWNEVLIANYPLA